MRVVTEESRTDESERLGAGTRTTDTERSRRRSRRILLIAAVVVLGLTTFVLMSTWTLLDSEQLRARIDGLFARALAGRYDHSIGSIEWSEFGTLKLTQVRIHAPEASLNSELVDVDEVEIDLDLLDIVTGGATPVSALTFRSPKIYIEVIDGRIPLFLLLEPMDRDPKRTAIDLPRVQVSDLEIHVCPETLFRSDAPMHVERFALDLLNDGEFSFSGRGSHPIFGSLQLEGSGRGDSFEGRLDVAKVEVDQRLIRGLPPLLAEYLDRVAPQGIASALIGFSFDGGSMTDWDATLRLREGQLLVTDPELAIEAIHGRIRITPRRRGEGTDRLLPERIETVTPISGLAWSGEAEISGTVTLDIAPDGAQIVDRNLRLELRDVQLGDRTRGILRLSGEPFAALADASTEGRVDLNLKYVGNAGRFELERVDLDDVRSISDKLPFPIDSVSGFIRERSENDYEIDLTLRTGRSKVIAVGSGGLTKTAPIALVIEIRDLPIDSSLEQMLGAVGQKIWTEYSPEGSADIDVQVRREEAAEIASIEIDARVRDGSMKFWQFPLEIDSIAGVAEVDLTVDSGGAVTPSIVLIKNASGRNGASDILMSEGRITWPADLPPRIDLPFYSPNLVADAAVYDALPDAVSKVLRSLDLNGTLPTSVRIYHPQTLRGEAPNPLEVEVRNQIGYPLELRPDLFPYFMTVVEGATRFSLRDRVLELTGLKTDANLGPELRFDGLISLEQLREANSKIDRTIDPKKRAPYDLTLTLLPGKLGGLPIDDPDFVEALPDVVESLLETVEAKGTVTGSLDVDYWPSRNPDGSLLHRTEFTGDLAIRDGSIQVGIGLSKIRSEFELEGTGGNDPARANPFDFEIRIGSERRLVTKREERGQFRFNSFFVEEVDARIAFGRPLKDLETLVAQTKGEESATKRKLFDPLFRPRLQLQQIATAIQVHLPSAKLYQGDLEGLFFVDVKRNDFAGHFETENMNFSRAAGDLFSNAGDSSGQADGEVLFYGDRKRLDSMSGEGRFSIRDGRLVQLPVLQAILSDPLFIQTIFGSGAGKRTIDRVHCRFGIEGDRFVVRDFKDLLMIAVNNNSVEGRGYMTFDRYVELTLRPSATLIPRAAEGFFEREMRGKLEKLTSR